MYKINVQFSTTQHGRPERFVAAVQHVEQPQSLGVAAELHVDIVQDQEVALDQAPEDPAFPRTGHAPSLANLPQQRPHAAVADIAPFL